ncbi:MAG TPA: DNA methyltransferase [Gemmataceae bacterium]|nr:DNA methyltransferase [Gemmataceae bacterium]
MASKRQILETVTRDSLLTIAQVFELAGLTGKRREEIIDALVAASGIAVEQVLAMFDRANLKEICRDLGLDDGGREKQVLIDRLLGRTRQPTKTNQARITQVEPMAKKKGSGNGIRNIEDYRHKGAKRKNNPPAKLAAEGTVPAMPKIEYSYSARRPPTLRFDTTGAADKLPELLAEATRRKLTAEEARILAEALRTQQPWLEWAGKRESQATGFTVDPVALHIHERISSQAILKVAARQDVERSLFSDPEQEYHEAVQFYKHEIDWTNRLILGDSLHVMASLARREDLAGKVQMIYLDPPYGIKYGSNFQPEVGRRDVKEKESDLTRELEMVKAYRDTWHIGIHSYLAYLRERLILAKELLTDSGSLFVQIGDENVHRVRCLLDEIMGTENFVSLISQTKSSTTTGSLLPGTTDFILWYAKNVSQVKYHAVFLTKGLGGLGGNKYDQVELKTGERHPLSSFELNEPDSLTSKVRPLRMDNLTSPRIREGRTGYYPVELQGRSFLPQAGEWKTNREGMTRLRLAGRLQPMAKSLSYVRYLDDFGAMALSNAWTDIGGIQSRADPKVYVVQVSTKVVERCMLMTTDPTDLILDGTCGSGTTAYVAEQWGRRWITIDTSRVAVAIARQRLLTAKFDFYQLRDEKGGVQGNFKYKTVPHITLKSIAQNANLDPIFGKHEPILEEKLTACNVALARVTAEHRRKLEYKLIDKERALGKRAVTAADRRRWRLPEKGQKCEHWTVPFDTDPDWPKELVEAVTAYRQAWRVKMDEVNACIAANAELEELVDQPAVVKGVVRVSGPFTVEAVQPPEVSIGGMFGGEPGPLESTFANVMNGEAKNVEAYLDQMVKLLRMDGVRFPDNKEKTFSRLERVAGQDTGIHAEGRWTVKGEADPDPDGKATVAVAFGPQYGPVTAKQVEDLIRSANRRGYDDLVIAGFSFDGPAQAIIQEASHPKLRIHIAHIRPDVNPGMNGLLKEQPGSQLFTVFGQPRTRVEGPDGRGEYTVFMEGVDIYDPVNNVIRSTEDQKVAAWFLDGDYDGRCFCITQAFFPDKSAWDKLSKALGGVVDPDRFETLSGVVSLPFPPGKHHCVAVKVIDPRGNEVMQVHKLG